MTRAIAREVVVRTPPDAVWRALTDPAELIRWFAPEARIEPHVGGSIWLSWGEGSEVTGTISRFEPGERLGWVDPRGLTVDFHVEAQAGETLVRLVHSGFGGGADWDEEFQMTDGGWAYFLAHLGWYLEKHRGVPRDLITWREAVPFSRREAFARLSRALAVLRTTSVVESPLTQQAGLAVPSLNDAILFLEVEPARMGSRPAVWLSTYGLPKPVLEETRDGLISLCQTAFTG